MLRYFSGELTDHPGPQRDSRRGSRVLPIATGRNTEWSTEGSAAVTTELLPVDHYRRPNPVVSAESPAIAPTITSSLRVVVRKQSVATGGEGRQESATG